MSWLRKKAVKETRAYMEDGSPNGGPFCLAFHGLRVRVGFRVWIKLRVRVRVGFRVRFKVRVSVRDL